MIISGNDLLAMGAIQALREKNIDIPNEISVFGFDDMEIFQKSHQNYQLLNSLVILWV